MSIGYLLGPGRSRLRPWVRIALLLASLAVSLAGLLAVLLAVRPAAPPGTVQVSLCGRTYNVPAGHILAVTGFGPHCTGIVTGTVPVETVPPAGG